MQFNLSGNQIDAPRRTGGAQDNGNAPSVQVFQAIAGARHDLVSGVQQGSVYVQENDRIRTHPIAPPPPSIPSVAYKYLSI